MKKSWLVIVILAALNVFVGASAASAQQAPIVGGYAETSRNDPEVVSAAVTAVRTEQRRTGARISLIAIEGAEVQVVAGLNYRLRLRVKVKGQTQNVTAIVYQNLKQRYSLTSWDVNGSVMGGGAAASAVARASTIEQLAKAFAAAYTSKSLSTLDAQRPYYGRVKVVIEHSVSEESDDNGYAVRRFATLGKLEQWLKSREIDDNVPFREARPLIGCKRGACTYDFDGGILHNHLYLQEITYGIRGGRPYLKTISFLDGD
jgi:hypothetical protein